MLSKWLFKLTANRPCRIIGERYLERYYVGSLFGWQIYLHRFMGNGDEETRPHDHPWYAFSLVLSGNYYEELPVLFRRVHYIRSTYRTVRFFNVITPNTFHKIWRGKPNTWTLFCRGPRVMLPMAAPNWMREGVAVRAKGWGFLEYDVHSGDVSYEAIKSAPETWPTTAPKGRYAGRAPW